MKQQSKRILALLMAFLVFFSNLNIQAIAAGTEDDSITSTENIDAENSQSETSENTDVESDAQSETVADETVADETVADETVSGNDVIITEYKYEDENVAATINIVDQWYDGYRAEVSIQNNSELAFSDWAIKFNSESTISDSWSCNREQNESEYSFKALEYNKVINSGESLSFGFSGTGTPDFTEFICEYTLNENEIKDNYAWSSDDVSIDYTIANIWGDGAEIKVRINNVSDHVIHNWAIRYICNDQFVNIYNAIDMNEESVHIMKNAGYNQDIPVDGYVEFGYNQYFEKEINIPTDFELLTVSSAVDNDLYSVDFVEESRFENNEGLVNLVIKNKSSEVAIEDWSLVFDANFTIVDIWNAREISHDGTKITLQNAEHAQNIAPDSELFVGMRIMGDENAYVAENFQLSQVKNEKNVNNSTEVKSSAFDEVTFENNIIQAGVNTASIVSAKVLESEDCFVKLYVSNGSEWVLADELLDDGKLYVSHDEIANDGIFTKQVSFYSEVAGEVTYKLSLVKNDTEIDSVEKTIEFYVPFSENDFINYFADCEAIQKCVNEYYTNHEFAYDKENSELVNYIKGNCNTITAISDITKLDGNTLVVTFANGTDYYIDIVDSSDMETMPRGAGDKAAKKKSIPKSFEVALTGSNRIMYWAPFDTEWGDCDETEGLKAIMDEASKTSCFNMYADSNASIETLKKMSQAGLVILSTHGVNGELIVTGEVATVAKAMAYNKEFSTEQITYYTVNNPVTHTNKTYIAAKSKWLTNNIKKLPNSIVINNSCYSTCGSLKDTFRNLGAKAYFGNNGEVTNDYATCVCLELVSKIVIDGEVTGFSYNNSLDSYYNDGASFEGYGQGNIALATGFGGIGFEEGISEWNVKGDCRILNKLGFVQPVEGDQMAMISTGVGSTMSGGAISKEITIPQDAVNMYLSWNFLSAEFLEYINSIYDDPFYITINDGSTNERIFAKSVNVVARDLGATSTSAGKLICVSPEIYLNDTNDVWMSDWQNAVVDISKYAGKTVTITFSADNAADTALATAMLLDAIHFDSEEYLSDEYVDMGDFTRGGTTNPDGKSYIFYTSDFKKQAEAMRKTLKRQNGYKKIDQVVLNEVLSETHFKVLWSKMDDTKKIDNVAIMMSGNYYAVIIDADKEENLVTNSEALATSDDYALIVKDLPQKKIKELNLYSSNAGLLDAINIHELRKCEKEGPKYGHTYTVNGNLAQAFLNLGGIETVTAYDGSLSYGTFTHEPSVSGTQTKFHEYVEHLEPYKVVTVNRYGSSPNGEVLYYDTNIASYTYKHQTTQVIMGALGESYKIEYLTDYITLKDNISQENEKIIEDLKTLYDLAWKTLEDYQEKIDNDTKGYEDVKIFVGEDRVKMSNQLVLIYLTRLHGDYTNSAWNLLNGYLEIPYSATYDTFCNNVKELHPELTNEDHYVFTDQQNNNLSISHLTGTLAVSHQRSSKAIIGFIGWAGDLHQLGSKMFELYVDHRGLRYFENEEMIYKLIGATDSEYDEVSTMIWNDRENYDFLIYNPGSQKIPVEGKFYTYNEIKAEVDTVFSYEDLVQDVDALNIMLEYDMDSKPIYDIFNDYYFLSNATKNRFTSFKTNMVQFHNDILNPGDTVYEMALKFNKPTKLNLDPASLLITSSPFKTTTPWLSVIDGVFTIKLKPFWQEIVTYKNSSGNVQVEILGDNPNVEEKFAQVFADKIDDLVAAEQ